LVQTPIDPGSAHDLHEAVQLCAQQTPWAQMPEPHSVPSEQNEPLGFLPHEFAVHTFPEAQLASTVHWPKHLLPLHANGAQATASNPTQFPVASQAAAGLYTPFTHDSSAQMVVALYFRQAPAPSQRPSVPQVEAGWAMQVPRGSAAPAGADMQTPSDDGSAQLRQAPLQAFSQQTPSTQKPLRHSSGPLQVCPSFFLPQLPAWHTLPSEQSASLAQNAMHAPALH
jgi:hypothetical protein